MDTSIDIEPMMTIKEVATTFRKAPWTMQKWARAGRFPNAIKLGEDSQSRWLIPRRDVIAILQGPLTPAENPSAPVAARTLEQAAAL